MLCEICGMYVTNKELSCLKGSNWINNVVCFIYKIKYDFDHVVTPFMIFKHAYYSYMTIFYMYCRLSERFVVCLIENKITHHMHIILILFSR